ncbi:CBS domain-containing protein [Arboricoccus pini]|uniref:CBS domain-containing protein n=1 Tax=Arboricoccus pini TaxID=1963835 RepID=A0A212RTR9_9PROT|nr:CBS domain-containing protein [Arboricoccus pini]SNB76007.1 CBS domain-containing protein [Arboricoccus pini]
MQRRIIPDVIDGQQSLCLLPPNATAYAAALLMRERRVGAVMVTVDGPLLGIVTERDLVYRLQAAGLSAQQTSLREIMTPAPETLAPDDLASVALEKMRLGHYRHLPIVDAGRIVGMVSIRDLYECTRQTLELELKSAESLIYGDQYGMASPAPN